MADYDVLEFVDGFVEDWVVAMIKYVFFIAFHLRE